GRLAPMRALAPRVDTVATVGPAALRSPALVTAVEVALERMPSAGALLRGARGGAGGGGLRPRPRGPAPARSRRAGRRARGRRAARARRARPGGMLPER